MTHGDGMLKIAVIGAGHLGALHAKMLAGIEGVRLTGIFDIDAKKAQAVAGDCTVPVFRSLDEAIASADAVSIAASTKAHFDIARQALEADRHVFVEKPMTATIEQARMLVELADQRKRSIQVGHIERFNPAILPWNSTISIRSSSSHIVWHSSIPAEQTLPWFSTS